MSADGKHEDHYGGAISGGLTIYQQFEFELDARSDSIASMLPSTVTPARFKNTVIAAVRQDPTILQATIRSLMGSVIRAAQDGLVPDGREGHIAVYNTKVSERGKQDRWEKRAQWNPMAFGLRKRLRELDGIIANAEVVHEKDHFIWDQGDEPRIEHKPAPLGTARGKMVGAYCIYKREDGTILHREVMDSVQVEMTRNQSKVTDSLMWTKFVSEGYRKSVLRRGIKTVPVSDQMREIVQRDDAEHFDFSRKTDVMALTPPPAPPSVPKALPLVATETLPEATKKAADPVEARAQPRSPASIVAEEICGATSRYRDWLSDTYGELADCQTPVAVEDLRDRVLNDIDSADATEWKEKCADRATELFGKKK